MFIVAHHDGDDRIPLSNSEREEVMITAEWARQQALHNVYSGTSQRALFLAKAMCRAMRICVCRIKVTADLDVGDREKFDRWVADHDDETGVAVTHPSNLIDGMVN